MKYKKILMVTMSLDIGGAETHVVELSKTLSKCGLEVIVASKGGVYVNTLAEFGIKHYTVPLHSKNPLCLLKSYHELKKIVKSEGIDIIHSHARIPAFISGLLCRHINIPFVTTCHGTYSLNFILKLFSNWGQKALAVSPDIKDYLINGYDVNEKDIFVTVNGIDTDAFSPAPPDSELMLKFNLRKDSKKILYLGRISPDSGVYAFSLLQNYKALSKTFPDLQFLVVGDGTLFDDLKKEAKKINEIFGDSSVILAGSQTNIPKLINLCDGAVALSRSALECMACEIPVILAGNYGYMGVFNENILPDCLNNNFTARGFTECQGDFLDDLIKILSLTDAQRAADLSFARQMVKDNYSILKMKNDAISVYNKAYTILPNRKYDFILLGYYGYSNSGDDALLNSIIKNLRQSRPDLSLCVMTNRPKDCNAEFSLSTIHRFNIFSVVRSLRNSKALIFGGGNLIQNITSTKSLVYYLSILKIAQFFKLKTMLYGNGIGPVYGKRNIDIAKNVLQNVDIITLREKSSFSFLQNNNITKPQIFITADETLTMDIPTKSFINNILNEEGIMQDEKYICVSVRPWDDSPPNFTTIMADVLDKIATEYSYCILFLPMHTEVDMPLCKEIASKMTAKNHVLCRERSARELIGLISNSKLTIGMRLHSLIYSVTAEVPLVGISYDEKVSSFLETIGNRAFLPIKNLQGSELLSLIKETLDTHNDRHADLKSVKCELKAKAKENCTLALKLLEGED